MTVEPIAVLDPRDRVAVELALLDAIRRGNPLIPTPSPDSYPPSPLLKHAKVKTPSAFEKSTQRWQLGRYPAEYVVVPYRPGKYGGAEEDSDLREVFPIDDPIESVVSRLVDRAIGRRD